MSFPEREQARLKVNARLYSPYLGRFVSPDPLLNIEGGPLDYNPYIYARNNPYKYIDRNGEFWWLVAPAIWGGFTSAFANFDCINSIGDFFANYGPSLLASGIATVAGIAVGGVVTAGCASVGIVTLVPVIAAGASGAAVYLTYNCVYSACTGTPFNFSWTDLGKDVGIAMVIAGIGVIASKLPKLSKIMQTRHKPIKTEPDAMPAISNAGKVNSAPINYENSAIQFSAYQKCEMGKLQRMDEIIQNGGTILGTEVTIEVNGIRIRPDIVYRNKEGLLIFSEVINGPRARLTHNQGRALPIMSDKHPVIFPKGGNAAKIPEFKNVMINNAPYTGNYGVEIIRYDPPILH